ncbi:MerR family transcriptional regulator [Brachybacterium phenoliresistens]|uniref:MerR family transcriptional regulator n=1 Tax=Brachybacterium phenoliresistens TaxID=396014 RepID=UPI0031D509BD
MRISELSSASAVSVGTIKYYLREGLLPAGERTSRTTAEYTEAHLERLRLIRALLDEGGLGIDGVRRVLAALDVPDPAHLDLMATAQDALLAESDAEHPDDTRARAWLARRGWPALPDQDPLPGRLEAAWSACERAGIDIGEAAMDRYADAVEQIARVDVASVPTADPAAAVHRVVVGTVMIDPVLSVLRLLAQRAVAWRGSDGRHGPGPGAEAPLSPPASENGSGTSCPPGTPG